MKYALFVVVLIFENAWLQSWAVLECLLLLITLSSYNSRRKDIQIKFYKTVTVPTLTVVPIKFEKEANRNEVVRQNTLFWQFSKLTITAI